MRPQRTTFRYRADHKRVEIDEGTKKAGGARSPVCFSPVRGELLMHSEAESTERGQDGELGSHRAGSLRLISFP